MVTAPSRGSPGLQGTSTATPRTRTAPNPASSYRSCTTDAPGGLLFRAGPAEVRCERSLCMSERRRFMRCKGGPPASKVAIFLHAGDYDRVHQGLSIAAAAGASGRRVDVFFFWWALERLLSD